MTLIQFSFTYNCFALLARAVPQAARRVAERAEFSAPERAFLTKVLAVIDEHAGFMREGL
ncbi:MAG TPA: hypothetical protein VJM14_04930 [Burkholderiales bacterium]|nr:hypothetical protein [Burkholderiales bacterium]